MKATRDAFGEKLAELGERVPNLVVLDADLSGSTRTTAFIQRFPKRHFEIGIAESNMLGIAAGLALEGFIPVATSFACFLTGRLETIRVSIGYNQANVKMVGTHAGIGIGDDGASQMGLEDIGAMRSLPNVVILQPADEAETKQAVEWMVSYSGPVYLRLTRQNVPEVHKNDYRFRFGKADCVFRPEGGHFQATVLASGGTVGNAIEAAEGLIPRGFKVQVLNIPTLKPMDEDAVWEAASISDRLVTVEDHHILGGLGSAVSEAAAGGGAKVPVVRIGVKSYGESGSPSELYEKHGLGVSHIQEACLRNIQ